MLTRSQVEAWRALEPTFQAIIKRISSVHSGIVPGTKRKILKVSTVPCRLPSSQLQSGMLSGSACSLPRTRYG